MPSRVSANMCRFGRKIEYSSGVVPALGYVARDKEVLSGGLEGPVECREECQCILGENLGLSLGNDVGKYFDTVDHGGGGR